MSMRHTPEEYEIVKLKLAKFKKQYPPKFKENETEVDPGPESELQRKIVADAKANGWPCLSFPQSEKVKRFLPPGWPDILIAMPKGRTVFLETKSATEELREKQKLMCNMFRMLGHEYYKVKSFKRYLEIKEGKGGR